MKTVMSVFPLLFVVFALSPSAHAIEKPNIDLYKGTLNGRVFYTLTIDGITDLFGGPSHQNKMSVKGVDFNTQIFYQDLGLEFEVDKTSCRLITIDISGKTLNTISIKVKDMNVKKYSGVLSKNIDGNWKLQRVMAEFKDYQPELGESSAPDKSVRAKIVDVKFSNYTVTFHFDDVTEFLDAILIVRD